MKIAVFGSNGMAGHMVVDYLQKQYGYITTIARTDAILHCDVENSHRLASTLSQLEGYDYIINCIGLLVKDSIARPDRAAVVNAWFPHFLEHWFRNKETKIIHLSTDCVFDGSAGPYKEDDIHTEMNAYGRSKSFGELRNGKDVTFRMSIIGPEIKPTGGSLLNWVLTSKESELPGWTNAHWNGITTLQLAKCIHRYLKDPSITGVHHVVSNTNSIDKCSLLELINSVYGLGKKIIRTEGPKGFNKILINTRPEYDWGIPDYTAQLTELRDYRLEKSGK